MAVKKVKHARQRAAAAADRGVSEGEPRSAASPAVAKSGKQRGKATEKAAQEPKPAEAAKAAKERAKTAKRTKVRASGSAGGADAKPSKTAATRDTKPRDKAKSADGARLMRDSFRMPAAEFERLRALKRRARALGRPVRKSQLLRAGLRLLAESDDAALLEALVALR